MSLHLDHVNFVYPGTNTGVHDVSFTIDDGEFVAVIGPSGCGKTTILKLLAGFMTPTSGRILFGDVDATTLPTRQRDLGIVFQNYALFAHMSVLENVAYPLKLRAVPKAERLRRSLEAVATVGLEAFADRRPPELSGGQQQRVALARALVFRPRALLLDEPLSALDAARRMEMRDEILRLQRAHGIATLHITHDQEEALSMADKVIVMAAGRVLQAGTPQEIYQKPATRTVAAFVGQANLWDGTVEDATHVRTSIGVLTCAPHGFAKNSPVAVLVRPEKVEASMGSEGDNVFHGQIIRDRYLGSMRRIDLQVPSGTICMETNQSADITSICIKPDAIQVLPLDTP